MRIDTITTLDSLGNQIITYDTSQVVMNTAAGPLFDVFQVNSQEASVWQLWELQKEPSAIPVQIIEQT